MKSRLGGIVVAIVLAAVGTVSLLAYVNSAEQRAFSGTEMVSVYVVAKPVPEGTTAKELVPLIRKDSLPAAAVPKGVVTDLSALSGNVTAVPLFPGEQLLEDKFVDPSELGTAGTAAVPEGMQEVTVQLGADRMVGGQIKAGDTVGVFVSFDSPETTHLVFQRVLVTSVQGAPVAAPTEGGPADPSAAPPVPAGTMFVTLARDSRDAENIVFAAEFGSIWLSKQNNESDKGGTRVLEKDEFYE